ncbi:hypothetical protein [Enterocloster bolteae]|uniref:hypothetical protein n=1 Tax=Enterocloster bolteae TaxID=208479 RepID=UPI0028DD3E4A|nr:hypothetical protein [Enterocloster bolteae]
MIYGDECDVEISIFLIQNGLSYIGPNWPNFLWHAPSIPFFSLKANKAAYGALQGLIQGALAKLILLYPNL